MKAILSKSVYIAIVLALFSAPVFAASFEDAGINVLSQRREGTGTAYNLKDSSGNEFTAVVEGTLTDRAVENVSILVKRFYGWNYLKPASVRLIILPDQIEAAILFLESTYKGVAVHPHLPSGMQFFLRDTLEYDFRIMSQNNFIRLRGWYYSEDELLNRVTAAIRNPGQFIKAQDPEYLFNVLSALEKDFAELSGHYQKLLSAAEDLVLLREAVLTLNNKGIFGPGKPIAQETVDKIVELKQTNPELTRKDMASRLKEEGVSATAREISLVYAVFFNIFD